MQREKVSARNWVEANHPPASQYIRHLPDVLREAPNTPIIFFDRVSRDQQERDGTLKRAVEAESRHLKKLRANVVATFAKVESGRIVDADAAEWEEAIPRPTLEEAFAEARRINGVLVAYSLNRLLRSWAFYCGYKRARPSRNELEALIDMARGVPIALICHPDMSQNEQHAERTKQGKQAKGNPGGRPRGAGRGHTPGHVVRRKKDWERQVRLMRELGDTFRQIAADTKIPEATCRRWLKSN